jgi:multidrug efflux pump subunit AcrA (membrane-fusion protein)
MPDRLRHAISRRGRDLTRCQRFWSAAFATLLAAFTGSFAHAAPADTRPATAPTAQVLGTEISTSDPEELRYLVLRALTDRYAAEHGIEVTPDEIDAYLVRMAAVREKEHRERNARLAEIERQLAAPALTDEQRAALTAERDMLSRLARDLAQTPATPQEAAEEAQARRTVAAAFIRQWKVNQALYRDYGGRIIFQQGGPEPLDAYRRFLEERQKTGAFTVADKELEAAFWRYYRNDAIHSFYPGGSAEEAQAFASPWWLTN